MGSYQSMKVNIKNIILALSLLVCFIIAGFVFNDRNSKLTEDITDPFVFCDKIADAKSVTVDVENYRVSAVVKETNEDGKEQEVTYIYRFSFDSEFEMIFSKIDERKTQDKNFVSTFIPVEEMPAILAYLPYILIGLALVFLWFFAMRQSKNGGKMGSFSRAHVKLGADEKNPVKFADVAGADEEKQDLQEVVEFLRDPQKFVRLGARIPRGVLLVGPPGTGKTLLAKAVAGEAGVPFYSISGSDFVEMYVGVGASRVRDLFDSARKNPASIIFIDEIDAVGRRRGAGLGGGHDEREQTLNQLLVEMDGFGTHEGIIVIAATNRPDILDPALLRPGRFDRQITVNYPDLAGREAILKVHCRNKPLEGNVELTKIAQATVGFTGADLANLLNEAALLSARRGKSLIGMPEIEEAMLKVMVGTEKKNSRITEEEKKKTAYHEAGHAILAHVLPTQDPVKRISVIPSGKALGYTLNPPVKDKFSVYKKELKERIVMLLGGRVAEHIIYGDVSGGASNDIKVATQTARDMVTKLGMSDTLGTVRYGGEHDSDEVFLGRDFNTSRDYSDETAFLIDKEIKRIIDEAFVTAENLLRENMDKLHFIAEFLVKYEVMDEEQFRLVMDENATMEVLEALIAERKRKSEEENRRAEEKRREEEARLRLERERLAREALGLDPISEEAPVEEDSSSSEKELSENDSENE